MAEVARAVTIDRIEGAFAVLVDGDRQVDVPLSWLPAGTAEGSALRIVIRDDPAGERALQDRIRAAHERLRDSNDGDDDLEL
jgi:hypothetical protein